MGLEAMNQTRKRGENKRLEALTALVIEARKQPLTIGRQEQLENEALKSATGLTQQTSRDTFLSQCRLVLDHRVMSQFEDILDLADRIWSERKTKQKVKVHSKLHLVLKISKKIASDDSLKSITEDYNETGYLPRF